MSILMDKRSWTDTWICLLKAGTQLIFLLYGLLTSWEEGGQIGQTEAEGEEEEVKSQRRRGRRSEAELIHRFDFINRDGTNRKLILIWQSKKEQYDSAE